VLYSLTDAETALAVSIEDILGYDAEVTITNDDNPADNDQVMYAGSAFENVGGRNIVDCFHQRNSFLNLQSLSYCVYVCVRGEVLASPLWKRWQSN